MSNTNISISLTCFRRLDFLQTVVNSLLSSNMEDISIKLFASVDYFNDDCVSYLRSLNIDKIITLNKPPIGCNHNTLLAIDQAINSNYSNYVLHLEDDTVLTKDALQYCKYAFEKYKDAESVRSITAYNKTDNIDENEIYSTIEQTFFCAWGCGFWTHKWTDIKNNWIKYLSPRNGGMSWDTHLNKTLFAKGPKYIQIKPNISRIQNIGATNGTYVSDAIWHYYNQRTPTTSDDIKTKINWIDYAKNNT
jgi:hypothetical protein